jgi:hypothetical protein
LLEEELVALWQAVETVALFVDFLILPAAVVAVARLVAVAGVRRGVAVGSPNLSPRMPSTRSWMSG